MEQVFEVKAKQHENNFLNEDGNEVKVEQQQ